MDKFFELSREDRSFLEPEDLRHIPVDHNKFFGFQKMSEAITNLRQKLALDDKYKHKYAKYIVGNKQVIHGYDPGDKKYGIFSWWHKTIEKLIITKLHSDDIGTHEVRLKFGSSTAKFDLELSPGKAVIYSPLPLFYAHYMGRFEVHISNIKHPIDLEFEIIYGELIYDKDLYEIRKIYEDEPMRYFFINYVQVKLLYSGLLISFETVDIDKDYCRKHYEIPEYQMIIPSKIDKITRHLSEKEPIDG